MNEDNKIYEYCVVEEGSPDWIIIRIDANYRLKKEVYKEEYREIENKLDEVIKLMQKYRRRHKNRWQSR